MKWRQDARIKLEKLGYRVTFFDSPISQNRSARIDFYNNSIQATIYAWTYGDFDFEAYYEPSDEFLHINKNDIPKENNADVLNFILDYILDFSNKKTS